MKLALPQKKSIRFALKNFEKTKYLILKHLKTGSPIPHETSEYLRNLTGSEDPQAHLTAVEQMHEMMEAQYHAQLLAMAPDNLPAYCEYMDPDEPPADWHEWLCDRLQEMEEGLIMRMMISAPPGHAKSSYASRKFPSWYMGRNAKHRFIQAGHTTNFCENEFGKKTKALVDSERFRDVFPDVMLSADSRAAGYWALANGGSYLTRGVGQGIAGFRANIAGVDDPFASREDAESPTIRDKVFDWFSADFTTRLLPIAPMYVVMTRWHSDDLGGRIEEMNKEGKGHEWYIINLPAIATDDDDAMGRRPGEPLWPDFYNHAFLMNLKASLPARDWNSLYQGKPMDLEGGTMDATWIQRYKKRPEGSDVKRTVVSVDSASKAQERNDYTAITVWRETVDGNHYLLSVIREKLEFNDLVSKVSQTASHWDADAILVEDRGSGTQYIQTQSGKAPAPVIPIATNQQSKEFRFDSVTPMFEAGQVYLPERSTWLAEYEAELLAFPLGKYDDQVDSTSQYLAWVRKKTKRGNKRLSGMESASGINKHKLNKTMQEIEAALNARREAVKEDPIAQALALLDLDQ